jgi:hypothetical protein
MKLVKQLVPVLLGFGAIMTMNGRVDGAAGKAKDVCIVAPTGGGGFNTFVLKEVDPLARGEAVALRGFYFTTGSLRLAPLHGSAAMGSDDRIRIGFFVHSTAESLNDFTVSGVIDAAFAGTVNYDNDGDFATNGTLAMQRADCSTITIP